MLLEVRALLVRVLVGFNPHPARRPGATLDLPFVLRRVSLVSILTRPEGRVLLGIPLPTDLPRFSFNPHPARRPGATPRGIIQPLRPTTFQSSPGPKAGCYLRFDNRLLAIVRVSILTRPEGRVLRALRSPMPRSPTWFQSSPGPKAGCYRSAACIARRSFSVSILTRPEGRVLQASSPASVPMGISFNPHPARRPGATAAAAAALDAGQLVSILTRPEGRVLPGTAH